MYRILFILFVLTSVVACKNTTKQTPKQENDVKTPDYAEAIKAIEKGDEVAFDKVFGNIVNLDSLIADGGTGYSYTLFGYACKFGQCKIAEKLIDRNASIDVVSEDEIYQYDALDSAIDGENECIVDLLLSKGANVNALYNENGMTPLVLACRLGNVAIAKKLIDKDADVNGVGDAGGDYRYYPILEAVEAENADLVSLLIQSGAKLNVEDKQCKTPLMIARNKELKEIERLIEKAGTNK